MKQGSDHASPRLAVGRHDRDRLRPTSALDAERPGTLRLDPAGIPAADASAPDSSIRTVAPSDRILDLQRRLDASRTESLLLLGAAVDAKDPYTQSHSVSVAFLATRIADRLRLHAGEIETISAAALLHDIGKIGVPDAILTKPGRLSRREYEIVKTHPDIGAGILAKTEAWRAERALVLHHHEWFDGRGYPTGLAGDAIPFGARVLHVADSIDAMLSPRSYKGAFDVGYVLDELRRGRGTQFDPAIADTAIALLRE